MWKSHGKMKVWERERGKRNERKESCYEKVKVKERGKREGKEKKDMKR